MTTTLRRSGLGGTHNQKPKRLKLMIYGPFGSWKTVNAHHLPRTRTLDFDDGMQSVEWAIRSGILVRPNWETLTIDQRLDEVVYETIRPPATLDEAKNNVFDEAVDKIDEWLEEEDVDPLKWEAYIREKTATESDPEGYVYPQFWDTLILDSGTSLSASTIIKALKETDRLDLSKSWSKRKTKGLTPRMIQDFGAAGILFEKFMTACHGTGKNIVLICHEYQNTDKKGNLLAIEPLLVGQLRQSVPKDFDEVWYARVKGTRKNSQGIFQTNPDPMRRCRSRLGCLEGEVEADFSKIRATVAEFYGIPEARLWSAYHGTAGAAQAIQEELAETTLI